jgi:hypothetical protein
MVVPTSIITLLSGLQDLPILACVSLKKGVADYIKTAFKLGLALL